MKKLFKRNQKKYFFLLVGLFASLVVVSLNCKKQEGFTLPVAELQPSSQQHTSSEKLVSSAMSRDMALKRINGLFKDELYQIKSEQVEGINKRQFIQWLRNSSIAAAEQQYLGPLLSSNVSEFVLLHNVTIRKTGKRATIALVAVPQQLYSRYTKLIVLTDISKTLIGKICSWFQCDYLDPNMCLCLYRIGTVPPGSPCPVNECSIDNPCRDRNGAECGDPNIFEVISAY